MVRAIESIYDEAVGSSSAGAAAFALTAEAASA
jgi:hypothetical protein